MQPKCVGCIHCLDSLHLLTSINIWDLCVQHPGVDILASADTATRFFKLLYAQAKLHNPPEDFLLFKCQQHLDCLLGKPELAPKLTNRSWFLHPVNIKLRQCWEFYVTCTLHCCFRNRISAIAIIKPLASMDYIVVLHLARTPLSHALSMIN